MSLWCTHTLHRGAIVSFPGSPSGLGNETKGAVCQPPISKVIINFAAGARPIRVGSLSDRILLSSVK